MESSHPSYPIPGASYFHRKFLCFGEFSSPEKARHYWVVGLSKVLMDSIQVCISKHTA